MATLVSDGDPAATRYRQAQRGLTRLLLRDVRRLRRLIIPARLQRSVPDYIGAVQQVVDQYARTSAALGAEFYDVQRSTVRATGPFTVPVASPPPEDQSESSLRWATKDLWPRDPDDPRTTDAQREPIERRLEQAYRKADAVAQKLVSDVGRATIRDAVREDRQAVAWARAAALGACAFCKMLATRGAVYGEDTVRFEAHDSCHCGPVPIFRGQRFELSAHAREWERLYREYAAPYSGDQLQRFRRALAEHGSHPLPGAH